MSIRLRLTLLYTSILVLTLIALGAVLYLAQAQATLRFEEEALSTWTGRDAKARQDQWRQAQQIGPEGKDPPHPPPLVRYMQIRDPDGALLSTESPDGVILPLDDTTLEEVQNGQRAVAIETVDGERMLIHSVPIMVDGQLTEIVQSARSLGVRDRTITTLGRSLLVGGIVATVIAFVAGWVLAGMALRPIHRITQTAQAIGAEHDFGRRVEHTGPNDEVGTLATTFNNMLAELQTAYRQLEQALDLQKRFVADVSHELRTPLTTINGNVELLRRRPPISDEDHVEVLADMSSESKRLIRLVNDLLLLARADAQRPLQSEPLPLAPIIAEACRQSRLLAPDRSLTCEPLPDAVVMAEADALKQVLLILLDNALRYTEDEIAVTARVIGEYAEVSVRDSGPGIEPELLPHLFERFSRGKPAQTGAEAAGSEQATGTGLGLSIARALAEAQKGTLDVESRLGEGSTFTLTLPLAAA